MFETFGLRPEFSTIGQGVLPSRYAVTEFATSVLGVLGQNIAGLIAELDLAKEIPSVCLDQRLASLWFDRSIKPIGWELAPIWDAIAGVYQTKDGWIRLHTNLDHHRAAALSVLNCAVEREAVAAVAATWDAEPLETAIVQAGGVAAQMRGRSEWLAHPQGSAVAAEPLVGYGTARKVSLHRWDATRARPLAGLKVLDLTRVLAGPVATRSLAGFGADVLRIDPYGWDEANVIPDITLGKRCARLDLTKPDDRAIFAELLLKADILVHGYRPGALDGLGFGEDVRNALAPNRIEVTLDAYGWTGPWAGRRGFDSLVQMSCGIADEGMRWAGAEGPHPLPVQALDHGAGYLLAASVIAELRGALAGGQTRTARLSLARMAECLAGGDKTMDGPEIATAGPADFQTAHENTPWGPAHRLRPALTVEGTPMQWGRAANDLGSAPPVW